MAKTRLSLTFKIITPLLLLITFFLLVTSTRFGRQSSAEELKEKFPDAQLMRPSEPPQYFNSKTKRWEPEHWPIVRSPSEASSVAPIPPMQVPEAKKRVK